MSLPNFVIAGVARCGTTSLYYYLKQHPEIGFPNKKEPKYFSSLGQQFPHNGPGDHTVDKVMVQNLEHYQQLFQGLGSFKRIGEASSDYLYFHRHSAARMRRVLGDVPIILCLRNPVDRAYSAYNNLVRDQRETLDFAKALAAEEERLANNWDWMWAYKAGGLYADQVSTFLNTFSQVKIVIFEDLKQDADAVVQELFAFLAVDEAVPVDTSTLYSHSGKAKNRWVAFLSNRENPLAFALRRIAMKLASRSVLERIASRSLEKEEMSPVIREELKAYFHSDVERLEVLLGRKLEVWK
ncbi:MAG: sulfotransferase [Mariprofundus sp.]|nr:sulfotransferase [Mariprofundus sp.]